MKKIKTTDITSTSAMPVKKGSLDHLQAAYTETITDLNKAYWSGDRVGTKPMALHGCINSGTGSTFIISAGALILDTYSEVFRCDATTVVVPVGQVLIGTITTTYLTASDADPVEFSDSTLNNVHEIRKIVWSSGASGSGTLNYSDLYFRNSFDATTSTLAGNLNSWTLGTGSVDLRQLRESKKITILFNINNTSTGGSNDTLTLTVGSGTSSLFKQSSFSIAYMNVAAGAEAVLVEAVGGSNTLNFTRFNSSWGTYTNSLDLKGQIIAEMP